MTPDALQGIRWKEEATYRVLSYYFGMRWNSGPIGDYVRSVLEPFAVLPDPREERSPRTPGAPPTYFLVDRRRSDDNRYELLYGDQSMVATMIRSPHLSDVLTYLFWNINSETIRRTGDFLLVHAGALVTPAGDGVLLPAPSGSGKTTLVAGLVLAGFGYLSDEAGAIDPVTGALHPYPKALTMKEPPVELFPDLAPRDGRGDLMSGVWMIRANDLRPGAVAGPSEVRFVIAPQYRADVRTEVVPMSRVDCVMELGNNALNLPLYGARAIRLLARVVARSRCYRLRYSDLDEGVRAVERLTRSRRSARSA